MVDPALGFVECKRGGGEFCDKAFGRKHGYLVSVVGVST
jgi:hypothetical protein